MNLTSKLSLYDIIAMVIPGGTILLYLLTNMGYSLTIDEFKIDKGLCWTIGIVISYILGIINHIITKVLWSLHRNDTDMIIKTLLQTMNEYTKALNELIGGKTKLRTNKNDIYTDYIKFSCCFIFAFAIIVFIIITVCKYLQYNTCETFIIGLILATIIILILLFSVTHVKNESDTEKRDKYYEAYTYVRQANITDIPIIEGQVAFLQAMLVPLLLWSTLDCTKIKHLIYNGYGTSYCCAIRCFILFVCVAIFPIVFSRMKDTYRIVWEYYEDLKRIESKKGESTK